MHADARALRLIIHRRCPPTPPLPQVAPAARPGPAAAYHHGMDGHRVRLALGHRAGLPARRHARAQRPRLRQLLHCHLLRPRPPAGEGRGSGWRLAWRCGVCLAALLRPCGAAHGSSAQPSPPPSTSLPTSLARTQVFRTNASYARWDEARKFFGLVLNRSREMTRLVGQRGVEWGGLEGSEEGAADGPLRPLLAGDECAAPQLILSPSFPPSLFPLPPQPGHHVRAAAPAA